MAIFHHPLQKSCLRPRCSQKIPRKFKNFNFFYGKSTEKIKCLCKIKSLCDYYLFTERHYEIDNII